MYVALNVFLVMAVVSVKHWEKCVVCFSAHLSTRTCVNRVHLNICLEGLQEELAHGQMDDHIGSVSDGRVQLLLQLQVLGGLQPAREAQ